VVEHRLAKARVASSNLVSRSKFKDLLFEQNEVSTTCVSRWVQVNP
jgi:hypothetical protein